MLPESPQRATEGPQEKQQPSDGFRVDSQPGKFSLSGAAGVGRAHIKHASALSKYFICQIHAAYLINPHHYFRGLTQALKLLPYHLTYTK